MIINREQLIDDIKARIDDYKNEDGIIETELWGNIVKGLRFAKDIVEDRDRQGYMKAIKGLDLDDLRNLRRCIDEAITAKENEAKVKIWRVSDGHLVHGNFKEGDWDKASECLIELVRELAARPGRHRGYEFRIYPELINESDIGEYIKY